MDHRLQAIVERGNQQRRSQDGNTVVLEAAEWDWIVSYLAADEAAAQPEPEPGGTFACPICKLEGTHTHSSEEVAALAYSRLHCSGRTHCGFCKAFLTKENRAAIGTCRACDPPERW